MINRYTSLSDNMVPSEDGEYVLYEDADKRITELEAKIEEFIYIESHGEDILSEGGADGR